MEYGLYTPTDWNKECELLKEYLVYKQNMLTPIEMAYQLVTTGLLFVRHPQQTYVKSFEEYKLIKPLI